MTNKQEPHTNFSGRPGSALASLIPDWATTDTSGCGCKSWIKKMDKGIWWCEANEEPIVEHLVRQRRYLTPPLNMMPAAVARAGAKALLAKAIKMSQ